MSGQQGNGVWINGWNLLTQGLGNLVQAISSLVTALNTLASIPSANNNFTGNNTFTGTNTFKPPPIISAGAVGTATLLPAGVISVQLNRTGIGNGADKTNDTLFSYGMPANSFDAVGRGVCVRAWGHFGANGNDKTITFQVNGVIQLNSGVLTDNANWWEVEALIFKDGANTQQGPVLLSHGNAIIGPVTALTSATDTSTITFTVTGASPTTGAASDVIGNGMMVEFLN